MKKYLIIAAAAALALASCAKFETYTETNDELVPIAFSNYSPKALSRVGDTYVASTTLVSGKDFAVYAWQTANGSFLTAAPGNPNFMNPAIVSYTGDDTDGDGNTYSPTRFWPSGDTPSNLSFTAYYPYATSGTGITAPTFSGNVGAYAFTAAAAAADMVDFCVADVVNDQVYGHTNKTAAGYNGTVNLPFKHMLTKVQFKFKKATGLGATTVIELVDAELAGIKTTGTLTATYTQNASPAVNALGTTAYAWSAQGTPATYEVTLNTEDPESSDEIVLTESASTVATADIFLMVPQAIAADTQKLNVTWNVKVFDTAANATDHADETSVGTNGLLSITPNTASLSFYSDLKVSDTDDTAASAIQWNRNDFITYTITIGPKPIWFTATVEGWAAEQNGYFNAQ